MIGRTVLTCIALFLLQQAAATGQFPLNCTCLLIPIARRKLLQSLIQSFGNWVTLTDWKPEHRMKWIVEIYRGRSPTVVELYGQPSGTRPRKGSKSELSLNKFIVVHDCRNLPRSRANVIKQWGIPLYKINHIMIMHNCISKHVNLNHDHDRVVGVYLPKWQPWLLDHPPKFDSC